MPSLPDRIVELIGADPVDRLLNSDEPAARWLTLTGVLGAPEDDTDVRRAHADVLADPGTQDLLGRIHDWERPDQLGGHDSPKYLPNLLHLLADMGLAAGDDRRIEQTLDAFARHQEDGRFYCHAHWPRLSESTWSSLPCDTHIIMDALVRFGRSGSEAVRQAMQHIAGTLAETNQGPGWKCVPDPAVGFRGPGRVRDVCPQVTAEAARALARAGGPGRDAALPAVRTLVRCWRRRGTEKPYMFGHGRAFKTVKWPPTWYSSLLVLDALGRYPEVWGPDEAAALPDERTAVAELLACLVAYNVGPDGTVTPQSCFRGFEDFSWGQKKRRSPFAMAKVLAILRPLADLAPAAASVDVYALSSSKGGSGRALPPRMAGRAAHDGQRDEESVP